MCHDGTWHMTQMHINELTLHVCHDSTWHMTQMHINELMT